jgi:hypothetical protein
MELSTGADSPIQTVILLISIKVIGVNEGPVAPEGGIFCAYPLEINAEINPLIQGNALNFRQAYRRRTPQAF